MGSRLAQGKKHVCIGHLENDQLSESPDALEQRCGVDRLEFHPLTVYIASEDFGNGMVRCTEPSPALALRSRVCTPRYQRTRNKVGSSMQPYSPVHATRSSRSLSRLDPIGLACGSYRWPVARSFSSSISPSWSTCFHFRLSFQGSFRLFPSLCTAFSIYRIGFLTPNPATRAPPSVCTDTSRPLLRLAVVALEYIRIE